MSGKLIVIEGLDGSGKATQSALLRKALEVKGIKVRGLSFPDYSSLSSGPVRMYLNGEFGGSPDDVDCYATSVLFAVDRFCSYRADWKADYEEDTVFVFTGLEVLHDSGCTIRRAVIDDEDIELKG